MRAKLKLESIVCSLHFCGMFSYVSGNQFAHRLCLLTWLGKLIVFVSLQLEGVIGVKLVGFVLSL